MKGGFFNFLLDAIIAFVCGVLVYLIGRDALGLEEGSKAAALFAGIYSGTVSCLAYESGKNSWSYRKANVLAGILGAIVGGFAAAAIGIG